MGIWSIDKITVLNTIRAAESSMKLGLLTSLYIKR